MKIYDMSEELDFIHEPKPAPLTYQTPPPATWQTPPPAPAPQATWQTPPPATWQTPPPATLQPQNPW